MYSPSSPHCVPVNPEGETPLDRPEHEGRFLHRRAHGVAIVVSEPTEHRCVVSVSPSFTQAQCTAAGSRRRSRRL
uniref:Uncharacterized protein n=1 Tax=Oryza meridionalis TaxID=40149 RepID=A0A0E0FDH5_9ORYZ